MFYVLKYVELWTGCFHRYNLGSGRYGYTYNTNIWGYVIQTILNTNHFGEVMIMGLSLSQIALLSILPIKMLGQTYDFHSLYP